MSNFSIIIPVYNEEKNIGVLLDELGDILDPITNMKLLL